MNNQFKVVNLTNKQQNSKGENFNVSPVTKKAIINKAGVIVAYIPDFSPDGSAEAICEILNKERGILVPSIG